MTPRDTIRRRRSAAAVLAVMVLAAVLAACSGSGGSAGRGTPSTTTTPAGPGTPAAGATLSVDGSHAVATLDPRFQSYNIEMVEVTGGKFWAPYDAGGTNVARPPIDLSSARLRNLARALGPVYIRVSGSWANSTYFDADGTPGGAAPPGFGGVLTGAEWRGVGEFATAVGGEIVTSFASSTGVRDANGVWLPAQARAVMQFSVDHHIPVVAAEFYNEPSLNIGVPAGYDAADFGRDVKAFKALAAEVMPHLRIVGPGATGDVTPLVGTPPISAPALLAAAGPGAFDVFSYHYYPKVSARCGSTAGPDIALTQGFLSRVDATKRYYEGLRDRWAPGAPIWVTETAEAACGGDRWAAQYVDVIRYVDTLGRLGDGNGSVVFHNTLAASDYGLLGEDGFQPRPDYWAAVLWHRLMGPTVLAVGSTGVPDLGVYAHCTPDAHGWDVTYAIVNSSATQPRTLRTSAGEVTVYQLNSTSLDSGSVALNGTVLTAHADGTLPPLPGVKVNGTVTVPPASVAFVVAPTRASACP